MKLHCIEMISIDRGRAIDKELCFHAKASYLSRDANLCIVKIIDQPTRPAYVNDKAELAADESQKDKGELTEIGPDSDVYEKGSEGSPAEMENAARYELPGDWHGHEAQGNVRSIEA